jgi:D-glycero-alpha-D-manno-heptose 1-phosphate guanylyltransferase
LQEILNIDSNSQSADSSSGWEMKYEAIILAGGLGTRLRSVVADLPKCMAPVEDIPFINFVISYLKNEGVEKFILSLGYKSEIVIEYINATFKDIAIEYVIEDRPLGTGGAIKLACSKVKSTDVIIVNGDTLFAVNLKEFTAVHKIKNAAFTVALKTMKDFSRYGAVEIDTDFIIQGFKEKQFYKEGFINGGIYALNVNAFLSDDLPEVFSFEKDFLEKNIGRKIFCGIPSDNYFIDIGIPDDYKQFVDDYKLILLKKKMNSPFWANSIIGETFFEGLFELLD